MNQKLTALALVALLVLSFTIFHCSRLRSPTAQATPYQASDQLVRDLKQLPVIAEAKDEPSAREWGHYVSMAKRLQLSNPDIIKSALRQVSALPARLEDNIRVMLLLRVCFECPSGAMRSGTHDGWVSASAYRANRRAKDMNWPVEYKSGRFSLEDSIDGYLGSPYDPEAEFGWMLANGKWRKL